MKFKELQRWNKKRYSSFSFITEANKTSFFGRCESNFKKSPIRKAKTYKVKSTWGIYGEIWSSRSKKTSYLVKTICPQKLWKISRETSVVPFCKKWFSIRTSVTKVYCRTFQYLLHFIIRFPHLVIPVPLYSSLTITSLCNKLPPNFVIAFILLCDNAKLTYFVMHVSLCNKFAWFCNTWLSL